ncbi:four helix bundle protein [Maribacter cobaltidurans]|uniref:Four helix bundle protein n=1 Tax=Maribacter cobaltidurans TaxID=1178778 RepID=A0A223V4I5_9FLAO|nr:four helix bundle protein [Maribacter cobaltidurans]ASV30311.1 four helix bundle protein [Maribacter cobaltidurans]GGD77503.1 four helix bundle protein [Maribacter cobaltidurans]
MNSDKKFDLEDRLVCFAADIVFFCKDMPSDMTGQYYGNQLLRPGGSSALNFGEAQGTNSDKDYINKVSITLKELKESRVNLRILDRVKYVGNSMRSKLLNEVEQLVRIIATIIKNKKQ